MALTALEKLKLAHIEKRFGCLPSSADEAMEMALVAEQTLRDIGPHDPAYAYFAREQQDLETLALLLEKSAAH